MSFVHIPLSTSVQNTSTGKSALVGIWVPSKRLKSWYSLWILRAILERQAHTQAADSSTVAPTIDLIQLCTPKDLATTPFSFGSTTSAIHQGTQKEILSRLDLDVACEMDPAPLGHSLRNPREHWFRHSPMDKRAFMKVKESSGEVPTYSLSQKKSKIRHSRERWLYLHHPSLKAVQVWARRVPLNSWFLPQGKMRAYKWVLSFPGCAGHCQRGLFLFLPIQSTKSWVAQLGVGE